jgi:hypothetical protein
MYSRRECRGALGYMTVEEQFDVHRDLRLALHAATSLQTTIRHADTKAQILLGLQGGMAVAVQQQAQTLGDIGATALLAVAGAVSIAWLAGLALSCWHLLAAMSPRLTGTHRVNRFAFPATRPTTVDIRDQRDEAWEVVSALAEIALAKHSRVRRSLPALLVASVSAGALLALTVIVGITT